MGVHIVGYEGKYAKIGLISQLLLLGGAIVGILVGFLGMIFESYRFFRFIFDEPSFFSHLFLFMVSIIWFIGIFTHRDFIVFRNGFKLNYYCSKNKYDKALKLINKKIQSNYLGYKLNWKNLKALVLIEMDELDRAEKILDELEDEYPNFLPMLHYKFRLESKRENIQKSLEYLERIYKVHRKLLDLSKNPLSKWITKKRLNNYIQKIKNDEDLGLILKNNMDLEKLKL